MGIECNQINDMRKEIQTNRLKVSYIELGDKSNELLILIHGNTSSNVFFFRNMLELSKEFYVIAPDLRGFGHTEKLPIDARNGVRVWSEDLHAFLAALNLEKVPHLLGWSLGGGIAMQYAIDYSNQVSSLSLINPLSPYGYSGTKDLTGTLNNEYASGTGASSTNPQFIAALKDKITDPTNPTAAPSVLKTLFAPGYTLDQELSDLFVEGMLDMEIGEDFYPGNAISCTLWPYMAPGDKGICNTMSPKYTNLSSITEIENKPAILWLRGVQDMIVSDACMLDIGYLGSIGYVPAWPGMDEYPPQAMVSQTRAVLDIYKKNGGTYEEYIFPHAGHSPNIECFDEFNEKLMKFLRKEK